MKMEIYNSLAGLNRGFDLALESLTILQQEGLLTVEYVQDQTVLAEELRAAINYTVTNKLHSRETEDRARSRGRLRSRSFFWFWRSPQSDISVS